LANLAGCVAAGVLIIALVAVLWAIGGFILLVTWNLLAPLWGGPALTYVQAVAAWVFISLIGGAFRTTVNYAKR